MKKVRELTDEQILNIIKILTNQDRIIINHILRNQYAIWAYFNRTKLLVLDNDLGVSIEEDIEFCDGKRLPLRNLNLYVNTMHEYLETGKKYSCSKTIYELTPDHIVDLVETVEYGNCMVSRLVHYDKNIFAKVYFRSNVKYPAKVNIYKNFDITIEYYNRSGKAILHNIEQYIKLINYFLEWGYSYFYSLIFYKLLTKIN